MTKLSEINEDNCVLHEGDIERIGYIFDIFLKRFKGSDEEHDWEENFIGVRNCLRNYFLKITKLNDLAKEGKKHE